MGYLANVGLFVAVPSLATLSFLVPAAQSGVRRATDALEGFAEIFSPSQNPQSADSETATLEIPSLESLEEQLKEHLQALGISTTEPFTLQVGEHGSIDITLAHSQREALENNIVKDRELLRELQSYLQHNNPLARHPVLHWPPS